MKEEMTAGESLLLKAATSRKVSRPPVWLMRQAGRILPQYRKLRQKVSGFKELVTTPELACEVTLQPVDELGVDAAILFSDILVIPEAMGLPYRMVPGKGPVFDTPVRTEQQAEQLQVAVPEEQLDYVMQTIRLIKKELGNEVPLIGFSGAPWTLLAFMVEGKSTKKLSQGRRLLYQHPQRAHALFEKITDSVIRYLQAQARAGVDIVQVFDSFAGMLSPPLYQEFGIPYLKKIAQSVQEVPVILFAKGAHFALEELEELPCEVLGLDWSIDPAEARQRTGSNITLQGNMDPCLLYSNPESIRQQTKEMVAAFGKQRYIANLGHGVYPDTPLDGVKCFVDTIKALD